MRALIDVKRVGNNYSNALSDRLTDHVLALMGGNDTVDPNLLTTLKGGLRSDVSQTSLTNNDGKFFAMCNSTVVGSTDIVFGINNELP